MGKLARILASRARSAAATFSSSRASSGHSLRCFRLPASPSRRSITSTVRKERPFLRTRSLAMLSAAPTPPLARPSVALWRKATRTSGVVGVLSDEVLRFRGRGSGGALSALRLSTTLAPPLPVRKTDLRVARLRLTTSEIARKASPRAKSVLVKPNFESLNRAVFVQERSVATRAALLDAAISLPSRARSAFASRARTAVRPRRCSRSRARKAFVAAAVLARQRRLCRMAAVDRPISSRGWKELGQRAKAAADADKVSQFVVGDYAAGRLVSHPHGVR